MAFFGPRRPFETAPEDSFRSSGSRPMRPGPAPSSARESRDGPGSSGACPHSRRGAGTGPETRWPALKPGHVHTDLGDDHPCDRLTAGRVVSRSAASRKGRPRRPGADLLHGGGQRVRQVQLQQEPIRPRLCTTGLQAPVGAIGQTLGIGPPATIAARIARLTPSVSVTTCARARLPRLRQLSVCRAISPTRRASGRAVLESGSAARSSRG